MAEEFKDEQVSVTVERLPACRVKYVAKANADLVKKEHNKAMKEVAKTVSLPGFRKGKAPAALLEKNYSHQIESEWQKGIADTTFRACEKLTQIPVLLQGSKISFDMKSHSIDSGAEMTFEFESEPHIEKIETKSFKLEKGTAEEVTDKKVDEMIDRIRGFFGTWKNVTDRAAKEGDHVRLDIDLLEGETPSRAFSNQRFEVAQDKMAKWMRDLVIGMKVGESKEGVSEPDEDATDEDKKKFEPKKVQLIVVAIEESELPAIDDELAKKVGVESVAKMREKLTELMKKQEHDNYLRKQREAIAKQLVETYPIDLPGSILQKEVDYRIKQQKQNPYFAGKWNKMSDAEKKAEEDKMQKEAEDALRLFYLCRKIVETEKLRLDPQKLVPNVKTPLDAMFADPRLQNLENEEQRSLAMSRLMLESAQDHIIEKLGA